MIENILYFGFKLLNFFAPQNDGIKVILQINQLLMNTVIFHSHGHFLHPFVG